MKTIFIASTLILFAVVSVARSEDKNPPATVEQAVKRVSSRGHEFGSMGSELQAVLRLADLGDYESGFFYYFKEADRSAWKALLNDEKADVYARLCATYFLMDKDNAARQFLMDRLKSNDLRQRYNAAGVLEKYIQHDPSADWGVDLIIAQIANHSLDGSGVMSSPEGDFPNGDRDDIMQSPIHDICRGLARRKERKAVPALRDLIKRGVCVDSAASALGEIGDPAAAPDILEALKQARPGNYNIHLIVDSLGALKYKPALPVLVSMLSGGFDDFTKKSILNALSEIGDLGAVDGIQRYVASDPPHQMKTAARRVLILMQERDPVPGLLRLFEDESYEPAQSDIISALSRFHDQRVVNKLADLSENSPSGFMRREAISGLKRIGNRQSLLELASLLDVPFPKNLKARWGWKGRPDFSVFFPKMLEMSLKQVTHQDFARDSTKWKAWIENHVAE